MTNKDERDIVLVFLNGENWNYYGTFELSKMIFEKRFPSNQNILKSIEPEQIDIIINIDQLGINHGNTYILYDKMHPFLEKFQ